MHLTIDIGNSRVKIYHFTGPDQGEEGYHGPVEGVNLQQLFHKFPDLTSGIMVNTGRIPEDWIPFFESALKKFILLGPETPLPFVNQYRTKNTLGYDRIAAIAGAHFLFPGKNILVIDAGTAITGDLITQEGVYLGGTISPGLTMRFKALATFTETLPEISPKTPAPLLGDDTGSSIVSGVMSGFFAETDQMINRFREKYNPLITIVTGGEAIFFDKYLKNSIFVRPDLVATGLNRILEFNEEN